MVFYKGRRGDIISRLPNGKIALVNKRAERIPKPGEKWVCRIDFEKPKFAVVTPIQRIVKKPVYKVIQYACGHSKKIRLYDKEMPENEEPEIRVTKFSDVCEKCKENCKHENIENEIDLWDFGLIIRTVCKGCRKVIEEIDFSDVINENKGFFGTDFNKVREAVRQRISDPELQRKVLTEIDKEEQYVKEYNEKLEQTNKLSQKREEIIDKIKRFIKENYEDYKELQFYGIEIEKDRIRYPIGITKVIDKEIGPGFYEYSTTAIYNNIHISEMSEELRKLFEEYHKISKELDVINQWLIENRPVE